jgi:MFS family permease
MFYAVPGIFFALVCCTSPVRKFPLSMDPQPERQAASVSVRAYVHLIRGNANFRRVWLAQIVSEIGDWFYTLAIYSLLLQLTGRAESVALALVLQVLPQTFVGPAAGVVNDRVRRRRVMIAADLARFVIVLSMLSVRSRSTVWLVYPLLVAETVMAAFFEPARSAVIPNITAKEEIIVANTLSSATWSVNLLIGGALGGVVIALLGRDAAFVLNAVSFLVSAILIRRTGFEEPHAASAEPLRFDDLFDYSPILEGIRYVRRDRRLRATVFAKAGELMIGPSWVLFTVMGHKYFPVHLRGIDPERSAVLGMSLLLGARGIGAIVGPLASARWAGQSDRRLRLGILFGYLIIAIGYAALGAAPNVWLACLCVMFAHCGGSTVWVFSTTLLQLNTEDRFRGRVFSADLGFSMLTIAVGAYVCGLFLDWGSSARTIAAATGLLMLLPAGLWGWGMQQTRQEASAEAKAAD